MTNNKDWLGNSVSWNKTGGYTAHAVGERQVDDYYATDPSAVVKLLEVESFSSTIWEPACGEGHLSKKMTELGKTVLSSDLVNRGYGTVGVDFLKSEMSSGGDIITNPPFKYAEEFIRQAIKLTENKVAMLLRIQFLEGQKRKKLFQEHPPKIIYVFSKRINCAMNGDFSQSNGAVAYAWYIWEKGHKGDTVIKWI